MTDTPSKLRALVLATALVVAAFAGAVAFSGAAAGAANETPEIDRIAEYDGNIEITFADGVVQNNTANAGASSGTGDQLNENNFTVTVDGAQYDADADFDVRYSSGDDADGEDVTLTLVPQTSWGDLGQDQDVTVTIDAVQADVADGPVLKPGERDVTVTSRLLEGGGQYDSEAAAVSTYEGEILGLRGSAGESIEVRRVAGGVQFAANFDDSTVRPVDTTGYATGETYEADFGSGTSQYFFLYPSGPVAIDSAVEAAGTIETQFNVSTFTSPPDAGSVDVWVDGTRVVDDGASDVDLGGQTWTVADFTRSGSAVRFDLQTDGTTVDVAPNRNLTVEFEGISAGGQVTSDPEAEVTVTGAVVEEGGSADTKGSATRIYRGAPLAVVAASEDRNLFVNSTGQDLSTGRDSRILTLDSTSDRFATGEYTTVEFGDDPDTVQWFRLRDLGLDATAAATSIDDTTDLAVDVTANRGRSPYVARLTDAGGDVVATRTGTLSGSGPTTVNFGSQPTSGSPYRVAVTDNATNETVTTADVTVSDATVSLDRDTYAQQRGDVVEIDISLPDTDRTTVTVGDAADNNWEQTVTVRDGDGDDDVTLLVNTYTAGTNNRGDPDGGSVYFVADDADAVTDVAPASGAFAPESAAEDTLAPADYPIEVYAGDAAAGDVDASATIALSARSTDSVETFTAPGERKADLRTAADVATLRSNGDLTPASTVAGGDLVVAKLAASGLEGVLFNLTHNATTAHPAANVTDAFFRASTGGVSGAIPTTDPGFDPGATAVWDFNVNQTNAGANADGYSVALRNANTRVVDDPASDTYWFVVDTALADEFVDGDELATSFRTNAANDLGSGTEVTSAWTFAGASATVETSADLDRDGASDEVRAEKAAGQRFSGTTTVAPGTHLTIRVADADPDVSFDRSLSTVVRSDRTWAVTADFTDVPRETDFTLDVRRAGASLLDEAVDGRVVGAVSEATADVTDRRARVNVSIAAAPGVDESAVDVTLVNRDNAGAGPVALVRDGEVRTGTDRGSTLDGADDALETVDVSVPLQEGDYRIDVDASTVRGQAVGEDGVGDGFLVDMAGESLRVGADPSNPETGTDAAVAVYAVDRFGNPLLFDDGNVYATAGDVSLAFSDADGSVAVTGRPADATPLVVAAGSGAPATRAPTFDVTDDAAETVTVTAFDTGTDETLRSGTADQTFTAAVEAVSVTASSPVVRADGTATVDVVLQLLDGSGDPVPRAGEEVTFSVANSSVAGVTRANGAGPYQTNDSGAVALTLTATEPGYDLAVTGIATAAGAADSATVTTTGSAAFGVSVADVAESVTAGDELTVTARVENRGGVPASRTVELRGHGGGVVDTATLALDGGETRTVSLAWATTAADAGTGDVTVATASESDTAAVAVLAPDPFDYSGLSVSPATVGTGEAVDVTATLTNTDPASDRTYAAALVVDGSVVDTATGTLAPGASTEVSFARSFEAAGTYAVTVGDLPAETVTVRDDTDPTADAGTDRTVDAGEPLGFDAAGSTDDVGVTSYEWRFGDGTTATGPDPTHTYDAAGTYAVELTVADAAGNTDVDTLTVTVEDPDSGGGDGAGDGDGTGESDTTPPTAVVGGNRTVDAGDLVDFDGTNSSDDTGIASYEWAFGDGTTVNGSTPTHTYATPGTYDVTLTVADAAGNTDTVSLTVTVESAGDTGGEAPTAAVGPNRTVDVGETVEFDGTASTDDGGIANYVWVFGDGATAVGPSPTHAYAAAGEYAVTLVVSDAAGNTDTATLTVDVDAAAPASFAVGSLALSNGTATTNGSLAVAPGADLQVTTRLSNTGDLAGTRTVRLRVGGAVRAAASLTLSGGERRTLTFAGIDTAALSPGTYALAVGTGDGNRSATLTVRAGESGDNESDEHASGVPRPVFDAVAGSDGVLDRTDIVAMVLDYASDRPTDGVRLSRAEVLALVRYYVG